MDYYSLDLLAPYSPDGDSRNHLLFDNLGPMMCPDNDSNKIAVSQEPTEDDAIANDSVDLLDLQPLDESAQENHVESTWDWESILNEVGLDVPQPQGETESADAMASQPGPVELPAPAPPALPERPPPAEDLASEGHGAIPPEVAMVQEPNPISTQQNEAKTSDGLLFLGDNEVAGDDCIYAFTIALPPTAHPPTPAPNVLPPCPSPFPQPAPASSAIPRTPSSGRKERVRNREKKIPKYRQPPCENEQEERKRQNACKARINRERKKEEERQMKEKLKEITADRNRLRAQLELLRTDNSGLEARLNAIQMAFKVAV